MTAEQHLDQQCSDLLDAYRQMDEVQRIIFGLYVRRLAREDGPSEPVHKWAQDLLQRYRNGKELTLSDLEM